MDEVIGITLADLTAAIHLVSHEHATLWPVTPGCGCEDIAATVWDHLKAGKETE